MGLKSSFHIKRKGLINTIKKCFSFKKVNLNMNKNKNNMLIEENSK